MAQRRLGAEVGGGAELNRAQVYRWLLFSIFSLVFAGIFAFIAAMARTPAVRIFAGEDFFSVALVVHVIFAVVVWFLGFEAVMWCYSASRIAPLRGRLWGWGLYTAASGMLLLALSPLTGAEALLIDYFPLLEHPVYFAGLILVALGTGGVAIAYIQHLRISRAQPDLPAYAMLLAALVLLITYLSFFSSAFINGTSYRPLVWGPGHIFQVVSTLAMLSAWMLLLRHTVGRVPDSPLMRKLLLVYLAVEMIMPGIYFFPRVEQTWLFTQAMMYGIALPSVPVALLVLRVLLSPSRLELSDPRLSSLVFSLLLFGVGGAMGFFATGADLRVPAHYHGVLGAVTLAFMGTTYLLLEKLGISFSSRISRLQPYLYGSGLLLIILGLFWAGMRSAPRKTTEYADTATSFAMNLMGLGSVIAVAGGAAFVWVVLIALLRAASNR